MTKENYVLVSLDGSGSMAQRLEKTIDAVNEYVDSLRQSSLKPTKLKIVVWDNNRYQILYNANIRMFDGINKSNYKTIGATPLYDAFARGLNEVITSGYKKRILVLMTDGWENASREYNISDVKVLVKQLRDSGGEVVFLGSDINIDGLAKEIGVNVDLTISYKSSESSSAFRSASIGTQSYFSENKSTDDTGSPF